MEALIPRIPPIKSTAAAPWPERSTMPEFWAEFLAPLRASLAGRGVEPLVWAVPAAGSSSWTASPEGYRLGRNGQGYFVEATDWPGAFYGLITLDELARPDAQKRKALPGAPTWEVTDVPRFAWRGIMIDSSRHYVEFDWLMQLLDLMARIKLNVLHWHLSDDQGWRFAVPRWPDLVEKGAWRLHSEPDGRNLDGLNRDSRGWYGGWYSDEQIQRLLEKARLLNILVVPEVDVPGHSGAALFAYPHLGCDGLKAPALDAVPLEWGVLPHVLCPGKDESLTFVREVFERLAQLFPSVYLHLGGDEVLDIGSWEHCPCCEARRKSLGLGSVRELEGWFMHQCQEMVRGLGRVPLAWDDVIAQTLPWSVTPEGTTAAALGVPGPGTHPAEKVRFGKGHQDRIYHFWANRDHLARGLEGGEAFVFSPSTHLYLDMTYGEPETKRWAGYIPVSKAYQAEPGDFGMPDESCLGIEAPLWSEHLPHTGDLDRLVWPRLLCAAEAAWSRPDLRDWESFRERFARFAELLDQNKVAWFQSPEL